MIYNKKSIAALCDHTLLKPNTTPAQIDRLCQEAAEAGAASVCVNGRYAERVVKNLAGTGVKGCIVVGFPLGAMQSEAKAEEVRLARLLGVDEFDMVISVGDLLAGEYAAVERDIRTVVGAAQGRCVKVIIETCFLNDDEKIIACELSRKAGATFVKTSTGFSGGGATVSDVALMRHVVGGALGVKASGGIRTRDDVIAMVEAGATRIGTGSMMAILAQCPGEDSGEEE